MNVTRMPPHALVIAALILVQVLFGVNYVVSKEVVTHFPPLMWASTRIIISSLLLLGAALLLKRPHPKWTRKFFVPLIGFALLGTIINQASFLVGLKHTTATNSAVLNTLIPVFTLLIVTVRGEESTTPRKVAGFLSALVGVLFMRRVEEFSLGNTTFVGDLLMIVNCLSFGFFLALGKRFLERNDRLWTTIWMFIYGSFGLTALAIPDWSRFTFPAMTPLLAACAVFAIVGGTLGTYGLQNWALAYARSSHVALFIYIQPPIASALAWAWKGEAPTPRIVAASLLIFAGIYLVVGDRSASTAPVRIES